MSQVAEICSPVDAFLAEHWTIQAMPESALRIMRMARDPRCDIAQLLKLIEQDAALSARLIKAVNSSFYALQTKITRLDRAVAFMGLGAVKEFATASLVAGLCKDVKIGNYSSRDLWDHSVGVAILAREFAVYSKTFDPQDAFLAGMLHDVGLLLASQMEVEKCGQIFAAADARQVPFTGAEREAFGFNHCELGTKLSQKWKFPDFVAGAICWHHHPDDAPQGLKVISRHIYIADTLCCDAKVGFPLTCALQEVADQTLTEAGLSREVVTNVVAKLPILLRLHLS